MNQFFKNGKQSEYLMFKLNTPEFKIVNRTNKRIIQESLQQAIDYFTPGKS